MQSGDQPAELVVTGVVVPGDRRGGTELGFPTANVDLAGGEEALPPDGVYAGWLEDEGGTRRLAAVSVGIRPTYYRDGGSRLLEAHVLDFDGDLYGQRVRVGLSARLRGQVKFSGSEELVAQMQEDIRTVRSLAGR